MPGRVEGKVCVVTGGASGIGLATCRRLAEEGGLVALADIDLPTAERAAAGLHRPAPPLPGDVTHDAPLAAPLQAVAHPHGPLQCCPPPPGPRRPSPAPSMPAPTTPASCCPPTPPRPPPGPPPGTGSSRST